MSFLQIDPYIKDYQAVSANDRRWFVRLPVSLKYTSTSECDRAVSLPFVEICVAQLSAIRQLSIGSSYCSQNVAIEHNNYLLKLKNLHNCMHGSFVRERITALETELLRWRVR